MKAILILLVLVACFGFISFNASEDVSACFGCQCTNSCDDDESSF